MVGSLPNTDFVMNNVFWVGVYPGLTEGMLDFIAGSLRAFWPLNRRRCRSCREDRRILPMKLSDYVFGQLRSGVLATSS